MWYNSDFTVKISVRLGFVRLIKSCHPRGWNPDSDIGLGFRAGSKHFDTSNLLQHTNLTRWFLHLILNDTSINIRAVTARDLLLQASQSAVDDDKLIPSIPSMKHSHIESTPRPPKLNPRAPKLGHRSWVPWAPVSWTLGHPHDECHSTPSISSNMEPVFSASKSTIEGCSYQMRFRQHLSTMLRKIRVL